MVYFRKKYLTNQRGMRLSKTIFQSNSVADDKAAPKFLRRLHLRIPSWVLDKYYTSHPIHMMGIFEFDFQGRYRPPNSFLLRKLCSRLNLQYWDRWTLYVDLIFQCWNCGFDSSFDLCKWLWNVNYSMGTRVKIYTYFKMFTPEALLSE